MRTDLGWQLRPDVVFLNHGSYGACPTDVLEVQRAWRDRLEAEPIRFLTRELDDHLARPAGPSARSCTPIRRASRSCRTPRPGSTRSSGACGSSRATSC